MELDWLHQTHTGYERDVTRVRLWKIAVGDVGWMKGSAGNRMRLLPGCPDWQPVQFKNKKDKWTVKHGWWTPTTMQQGLIISYKYNWPQCKKLVQHVCRQLMVFGEPMEYTCKKKEGGFVHNIGVTLALEDAPWRHMAWAMLRKKQAEEFPAAPYPPMLEAFCQVPHLTPRLLALR